MTKQVRTAYRSHRKAAWVVALAVAGAVAAVVIPLANAAGKTYTLTATPAATCASPATTQVTIKNTGSPQTLGSAEIYFPPNTVNTVASASAGTWRASASSASSGGTKDILGLDNINLAPGASRSVNVTFKPGVTFNTTITAAAKQSNRFNDAGGGANLFDLQGAFPTLKIVTCVTVSGQVYQDRNLDNTFTTGNEGFDDSDLPKAWTVRIYEKIGGSYSPTAFATTTSSGTDGAYTFTQVPTGSDYKICVTATTVPDSSSKWALQSPTGNTECAPISNGGPTTAANLLPNLSANASGKDFQVVPVVGPFGKNDVSTVPGYIVEGGSSTTKPDQFYVQDTWVDSQGHTNFRFSPIGSCAANCSLRIYLLETLTADIALDDLDGHQAELRYDDSPPFLDADLNPMPYCDKDPGPASNLATVGVLPGSDTSCIVSGQQTVTAGNVHVVYHVYTAYDGGRQIG